jgi:hypothetical protein
MRVITGLEAAAGIGPPDMSAERTEQALGIVNPEIEIGIRVVTALDLIRAFAAALVCFAIFFLTWTGLVLAEPLGVGRDRLDRMVDERHAVMPAPHHFGFDPFLGDVAPDQLRQVVNVLQAPYAVCRIVVEFLHVLLEVSDRRERAVASKVADPDWRNLKCRVPTVTRYGNGARLPTSVSLSTTGIGVVSLVALVAQEEFTGRHDVARQCATGEALCVPDHWLGDAVAKTEML